MGFLRIEGDLEKLRAHAADVSALQNHLDLLLEASHIREESDLVDVLLTASDERIQSIIYRLLDVGSIRPEQKICFIKKGLASRKKILETTILNQRRV